MLSATQAQAEPASLAIVARATATYDSNVLRLSDAEQRLFNLPSVDDFILSPTLGSELRLPFGLQAIELGGDAGYNFHRHNTQLDSETVEGRARFAWAVSDRCDGFVRALASRRLQSFEDSAGGGKVKTSERLYGAQGECRAADLKLRLAAERRERDNQGLLRRDATPIDSAALDLRETSYSARLSYSRSDVLTLFTEVQRQRRAQPNRTITVPPLPDDRATITLGGGGFEWRPSPFLTYDISVFQARLRESSGRRDSSPIVAEMNIDWELTGKTRLRLGASKQLDVSPLLSAIAFSSRSARAEIQWDATAKISSTLAVSQTRRTILRDIFDSATLREEQDRTRAIEWRTRYAFDDRFGADLGISYRERIARCRDGVTGIAVNCSNLAFSATIASLSLFYRFTTLQTPPTP
jgi:hypothetical protein